MIKVHFRQFVRAVMLAAFAIFLIELHVTGDITKYINPKYTLMSMIGGGIFSVLFVIQLFRIWENHSEDDVCCSSSGCSHDHKHGETDTWTKRVPSYCVLAFPLITGFAFAPAILDSSIAANKGTILPQSNGGGDGRAAVLDEGERQSDIEPVEPEPEYEHTEALPNDNFFSEEEYDERMSKLETADFIDMKDDIYASYLEEIMTKPGKFAGINIKVKGFVYKEDSLAADQFVVSRFLITHCIADASVVGMLAQYEEADKLELDTWLEVEGTLEVTTYNGEEMPLIKAKKVKEISVPTEPYVYPILTNLTE